MQDLTHTQMGKLYAADDVAYFAQRLATALHKRGRHEYARRDAILALMTDEEREMAREAKRGK